MDPASVAALVGPGDVLVSTVGPFVRYGGAAVEAAVMAGAHYVDTTGEPAFVRGVFDEWAAPARAVGSVLLPAFGYDYLPGQPRRRRRGGPGRRACTVGRRRLLHQRTDGSPGAE